MPSVLRLCACLQPTNTTSQRWDGGITAARQLPAVHGAGWDPPATWCHTWGEKNMSPLCSSLPELVGMKVGTEHMSHHGPPCTFLPLVPGTSHRPHRPPVTLGFPSLSQEDTKGSCCLSRLLTLLSQIPSVLLPATPTIRPPHRPPTLPWVLPLPSPSCPSSLSGLSPPHHGQDPGGFRPRLSVKLISHVPLPPLAASQLPVTPSPHSSVCNKCGISELMRGKPFLPIISD